MVSQTKPNEARARAHARQRKQRATLRFPPTVQAPDAATAAEQKSSDDDVSDEWFRTGTLGQTAEHEEAFTPDSGARHALRPRPITLSDTPERTADPRRRRRLAALVSLIVLASVAIIAVAIVARRQHRAATGGATKRADSVPASNPEGRHEVAKAAVTLADRTPPTPEPTAAQPANAARPTPEPPVTAPEPAQKRSEPTEPAPSASPDTMARLSHPSSQPRPQSRSTTQRSAATVRPSSVEPGIPFNQIYVNRRGELVDAEGKPLEWKRAPAAPQASPARPPGQPRN